MTERPVFIPAPDTRPFVTVVSVAIQWHAGFAAVQKKKNVAELHSSAAKLGLTPLLEISTKSEAELGRRLSAFSLKVKMGNEFLPLESAFQGSKVFANGGPYTDLYWSDARSAKRDERTRNSGPIVGFRFGGVEVPNLPRTLFYDWLYLSALYPHRDWISSNVPPYTGFTDIEFNPSRSINCQAKSFALMIALITNGLLDRAMESPLQFRETVWANTTDDTQQLNWREDAK